VSVTTLPELTKKTALPPELTVKEVVVATGAARAGSTAINSTQRRPASETGRLQASLDARRRIFIGILQKKENTNWQDALTKNENGKKTTGRAWILLLLERQ
jgi:hypothetical protein